MLSSRVKKDNRIQVTFFVSINSRVDTKTDAYANSVDPDEKTRYKLSYQDLHCRFVFDV